MITYKNWSFPDIDTHFQNSVDTFPKTWYQQATLDKAYKYISDYNFAIDIGANIGLHTVRFASKFKKVISFEPVTTNFECLEKNTNTLKNVEIFKNGVGSISEILNIKVPYGTVNCGAYSFVDFEDYENTIQEEVKIVRLDDYQFSPDLIKIDTQGFEEQVLLGAVNTLMQNNPVIIAEAENKKQKNKIDEILIDLNYQLVDNHRRDYVWIKK